MTFEQHNHIHNMDINRHPIYNLYRLQLYTYMETLLVLDILPMDTTHRLCIESMNILCRTIILEP